MYAVYVYSLICIVELVTLVSFYHINYFKNYQVEQTDYLLLINSKIKHKEQIYHTVNKLHIVQLTQRDRLTFSLLKSVINGHNHMHK